jgi:hypothetical protein
MLPTPPSVAASDPLSAGTPLELPLDPPPELLLDPPLEPLLPVASDDASDDVVVGDELLLHATAPATANVPMRATVSQFIWFIVLIMKASV